MFSIIPAYAKYTIDGKRRRMREDGKRRLLNDDLLQGLGHFAAKTTDFACWQCTMLAFYFVAGMGEMTTDGRTDRHQAEP